MPTQGFIDRETSRHCFGQPEPLLGGIAGNRGDPALLRRQKKPQTLAPAPPVGRTTVSASWSRLALARASNLPPISLFSLTGSTFSSTYFAHLPWFQGEILMLISLRSCLLAIVAHFSFSCTLKPTTFTPITSRTKSRE